jgi:hypothetical protein
MTRHELLLAQTATSPSRPEGDLAPLDGWIVITPSIGHICRRRLQRNDSEIELFDLSVAAQSHSSDDPQVGQIQKYP